MSKSAKVLCMAWVTAVILVGGCDRRTDPPVQRTESSNTQPQQAKTQASQGSREDSLYVQTLETLHAENRQLQDYLNRTLDTLLQMKKQIEQIQQERDAAKAGAREMNDSVEALKKEIAARDQKIAELQQTNTQLQTTITSLNAQLEQLLYNSSTSGQSTTYNGTGTQSQ